MRLAFAAVVAVGLLAACGGGSSGDDGGSGGGTGGGFVGAGGGTGGGTGGGGGGGAGGGGGVDAGVKTLSASFRGTAQSFQQVTMSEVQFKLRVIGYKAGGSDSFYVSVRKPPADAGTTYSDPACLMGYSGTLTGNTGGSNTGTWTHQNGGSCSATVTIVDPSVGPNGKLSGTFSGTLILQGGQTNSVYVTGGAFEAY